MAGNGRKSGKDEIQTSSSTMQSSIKAGKLQRANKYMFGIKIPRTIHEAYTFDKENKNKKWTEAIKTEVNQMGEHHILKKLPMRNVPDSEYQQIPYHFVFDVKFDLCHRARLVAGGNWTSPRGEDAYSSVVSTTASD